MEVNTAVLKAKLDKAKSFYNPRVMYKLGKTSCADANARLSVGYSKSRNFKRVPLGEDYDVITKWSAWVTEEEADRLEASFKKMVPKLLHTDIQYNGITECRVLTTEEYTQIRNSLFARFPRPEYDYRPGTIKVYFIQLIKKT